MSQEFYRGALQLSEKIQSSLRPVARDLWRVSDKIEDTVRRVQLGMSDWPALSRDEKIEGLTSHGERTWKFYSEIIEEDRINGWQLLKEHEQWYSEQIEIAEAEEQKWESHRELGGRIFDARVLYYLKRRVLRRFTRKYMMTSRVPEPLSPEEAKEIARGTPGALLAIDGRPEDVLKVFEALCDWTADSENRRHPFTTTKENRISLCKHVAEKIGFIGQDGAARVESVSLCN